MNALNSPTTVGPLVSETDSELRRLRDKIDGLHSSVSILLERLQPVTRQVPGQETPLDKQTSPESPLANEIAAVSREVISITMRIRERTELLAI